MKLKLFSTFLMLIALLLVGILSVGTMAVTVENCSNYVNATGEYLVQNDLIFDNSYPENRSACINFSNIVENVVFDCQGNAINLSRDVNIVSDGVFGITLSSATSISNVTIKNCRFVQDYGASSNTTNAAIFTVDSNNVVDSVNGVIENNSVNLNIASLGYADGAITTNSGWTVRNNILNVSASSYFESALTVIVGGAYAAYNNTISTSGNATVLNAPSEMGAGPLDVYGNEMSGPYILKTGSPGIELLFYNNLVNWSINIMPDDLSGNIFYMNMSQQNGTPIRGGNGWIGGNFWADASGTGYSETCSGDANGFCVTYNLTNVACIAYPDDCGAIGMIDYLPLAASLNATPNATISLISPPHHGHVNRTIVNFIGNLTQYSGVNTSWSCVFKHLSNPPDIQVNVTANATLNVSKDMAPFVGGNSWRYECNNSYYNVSITSSTFALTVDNVSCVENWTCSGYGACVNLTQNCTAVTDENTCGTNYTGNYSEFPPQPCGGTPPSPSAIGLGILVFDLILFILISVLDGMMMRKTPETNRAFRALYGLIGLIAIVAVLALLL